MFYQLRYEWKVRRALKMIAGQRVATVLQPGNVWVIAHAMPNDEETDAIMKTCSMRGWVEPLGEAVPQHKLNPDFTLPDLRVPDSFGPLWKLTDSGWGAIHRSHQLVILGLFLSLMGVVLAIRT